MAKTARPRSSSFFDATAMKRLTGFFGGSSSDHKAREGMQTPPPPLPPIVTNLNHQRRDSANKTPINGTPTAATPTALGLTLSAPSPSPLVIPHRGQSLTHPVNGTIPHPSSAGTLSPYLHPQSPHVSSSPVTSTRTSHRNFSGASAMSAMSTASHTSYASSRPASPMAQVPMPPSPTSANMFKQRQKQRRGGVFGKKRKDDVEIPAAWRLMHASSEHLEGYNFGPLVQGDPVPDMWEPNGDTLVFLAPKNATNSNFAAPSFRISSSPLMFSALGQFIEDLQFLEQPEGPEGSSTNGDLFLEVPIGVRNPSRPGSTPTSSLANEVEISNGPSDLDQLVQRHREVDEDENVAYKLYYPALELNPKSAAPVKGKKHKHSTSDAKDGSLQQLVDARNLFAFLGYTFLVATLHRETPFQIMEKIYKQLQSSISPQLHPEDHSPMDAVVSRRISAAEGHFLYLVDQLKLDDIRNDDDAIIEALIMGERWKCQRMYREGFIHACGRWEDIKNHPGCAYLSSVTKSRLDRASIDLHQIRLQNVATRLTNFDYPSVWVGDGRYPEFKPWKAGFDAMRKFTLSYYKQVYGSWPPRAGKHGKGGGYTEAGGLNRMVLKRLYNDFCSLYDLLVDREWIHGDRIRFDGNSVSENEADREKQSKEDHGRTTMRKIMSDFDQSYMPVQPNIPFDQPRMPYIPPTPPPTADGSKKKKKSSKPRSQKKLKPDELLTVLRNSYNNDAVDPRDPNQFVDAYQKLERDFGSGKTLEDIAEARKGRWIFIYCVLQCLPMTVVDAVGCQYGDGVEYFLCENVKGLLPWERSKDPRASRLSGIWGVTSQSPYGNIAAGASTSNLAGDDEVDYTYRRSHCWDVAEDWRMVKGLPMPEGDAFELDGESGAEEFIEYRPLDDPLPDSPKEMSPVGLSPAPPFRQSPPPPRQSPPPPRQSPPPPRQSPPPPRQSPPPLSERNQSRSPDVHRGGAQSPVKSYEGRYVTYHSPSRSQSQGSNHSNTQESQSERYHPGTYHPGTYPESVRHVSYQSQLSQKENDKVQDLPTVEYQQQVKEALDPHQQENAKAQDLSTVGFQQPTEEILHLQASSEVEIPMSSTYTDATFASIQEQLDCAFPLHLPSGSDHNDNGRRD